MAENACGRKRKKFDSCRYSSTMHNRRLLAKPLSGVGILFSLRIVLSHSVPTAPQRVDYLAQSARIIEVVRNGSSVVSLKQWACGAAGSALPWHGRGRRFDPDQVHQLFLIIASCADKAAGILRFTSHAPQTSHIRAIPSKSLGHSRRVRPEGKCCLRPRAKTPPRWCATRGVIHLCEWALLSGQTRLRAGFRSATSRCIRLIRHHYVDGASFSRYRCHYRPTARLGSKRHRCSR